MKQTLILSKNFFGSKFTYPSVYLGRSSRTFFNENCHTIEDKTKAHDCCNQIYNSIISDLVRNLNTLHKVNYSFRSWNIILGYWLRLFIHSIYENYFILDKTLKNLDIEEIFSFYPEEYDLFTFDTYGLYSVTLNEEWNCALNSKIIKFFNIKKKIIYKTSEEKYLSNQETFSARRKNSIFNFLNLIGKVFNIFKKDEYACIYKTYLPFVYEKKLEIKMGQLPQFWNDKKISFKPYDKNLRKEIDLKSNVNSSKFEEFLRVILPSSLPVFVLESFKDINELSEKSDYPKNPSFIFTSEAFAYDEVFKFYTAKKTQDGVPYFIGQHGNSYFTHVYNNYATEVNVCDKFISWGFKDNHKVIPTFNFKTLGKRKLFNNKGKLLVAFRQINISAQPIFNLPAQEKKDSESTIKIISGLNTKIQSQTVAWFRFDSHNNLEPSSKEQLKNLNITIKIGNKRFRDLLKESRLTFFNYDSTGILENLALNIPTICFWDNVFGHINPNAVDTYKLLIDAKILFKDPTELIKHVENNWLDINSWWMNKNTQDLIKEFNSKINIPAQKNSLENLKKILTQTTKQSIANEH